MPQGPEGGGDTLDPCQPNIATIQTDERMADKIHFLPVNPEFVTDVIEKERPDAILLGFGGQTALNCGVGLSRMDVLSKYGVKVLGTQIRGMRSRRARELFKETMLEVGIACPRSKPAYSVGEAHEVVKEIGYPVIMRVAYTLGGRGGGVAHNERELDEIVQRGLNLSMAHQVLIGEYIGHWKQIEYEVMRDSDDRRADRLQHGERPEHEGSHRRQHRRRPLADDNQPRVPHAAGRSRSRRRGGAG